MTTSAATLEKMMNMAATSEDSKDIVHRLDTELLLPKEKEGREAGTATPRRLESLDVARVESPTMSSEREPPKTRSESDGSGQDPIRESVRALAVGCNLREDFIVDLVEGQGDDWSFVIKLHALLESVVCQMMATSLKCRELEEPLAQEVTMESRITMLKALGLADENERRMMRALGRLRNSLVHNANQTDFTFKSYLSNKQRRDNFASDFAYGWPDPIPGTNAKLSRAQLAQTMPRLAVLSAVLGIASKNVSAKVELAKERRQQNIMDALLSAAPKKISE